MPSKDLQKDLRQVKSPGTYVHLCEVKSGDIDDSICFSFPATSMNIKIDLQAIVLRKSLLVLWINLPLTAPQSLKTTPQVTISLYTPLLKMFRQQLHALWRMASLS